MSNTAIQFLNPNQIPEIAFDAPLHALAKLVQWKWPYTHREDKYVRMLGGLHIEWHYGILLVTIWRILVGLQLLYKQKLQLLKTSHLTRTRHAHHFTLLALCMLQEEAFKLINGSNDCDNDLKET